MTLTWEVQDENTSPALTAAELIDQDETVAWERLPGESAKNYDRFATYRDLDPTQRTWKHVARTLNYDMSHCHRLAKTWVWEERARRWDAHLEAEELRARVQTVREMGQRHAQDALDALQAHMLPLLVLAEQYRDHPEEIKAEIAALPIATRMKVAATSARLLPALQAAERLARGEPSQITEHHETHEVRYGDIDELTAKLEALAGTGVLDALMGTRGTGPIVDAEVVALHPDRDGPDADRAAPEASSLPARTA